MTRPNHLATADHCPDWLAEDGGNLLATVAIAGRRSAVSAERCHLPADFYVGFNEPAAANSCGPVRSPSPLPSPAGRGNGRPRVRLLQQRLPQTQSLVLQRDWEWSPLYQRERAGVGESRAHSPNGCALV